MTVKCIKEIKEDTKNNLKAAEKGKYYYIKDDYVRDEDGSKICSVGYVDFGEHFLYI